MKYVKVEPQFKKCVTDTTTWKKVIEGETAYLTKCETYRGGSFLINVPETPEEIKECLAYRDMTLSDAYEYFGEDLTALRAKVEGGADLAREVMVLNNPEVEARVTAVLAPLVGGKKPEPAKKGFFSRLFGK